MNWEHINELINRDALYDFTDRKASIGERCYIVETFDERDKFELYEMCFVFCCDRFDHIKDN